MEGAHNNWIGSFRYARSQRLQARGVTMLEMAVVVAIAAVLAAVAAPSFSQFLKNSQIKGAAESVENGLRLARAEAVRHNTLVRFQLTTSVLNDCALSTANANWVISVDDPSGLCASTGAKDAYPLSDTTHNPAPRILQKFSSAEGAQSASVVADQTTVVFNGIGKITPTPSSAINFNFSNPQAGNCIAQSGTVRCMRVVVSAAGQVRMCDPSFASTDPRGC